MLIPTAFTTRMNPKKPRPRSAIHGLNAAYHCLAEPKSRLLHLLELELGAKPKDIQPIPATLADLFAEVANTCRKADGFLDEKNNATSPLLQVQLFERGQDWIEKLNLLQRKSERTAREIDRGIKIARHTMDFSERSFATGNVAEAGGALPAVQLLQPLEQSDSGARRSAFVLRCGRRRRCFVSSFRGLYSAWKTITLNGGRLNSAECCWLWHGMILRHDAAVISLVAAAVNCRVAVQHFLPFARRAAGRCDNSDAARA